MKAERDYQADLIKRLHDRFPGGYIFKMDSSYMQGIPDLLILYKTMWAALEVKKKKPTRASDWEPNQEWYLEQLHEMSFAACIYPENEEEVLYAIQHAFRDRR